MCWNKKKAAEDFPPSFVNEEREELLSSGEEKAGWRHTC